ncbi:helix-turn-helix domain-containing protein [Dysgonomonas reticulitermitis]
MNLEEEFNLIKKKQDKTLALLEELRSGVVDNKDKVYDMADLEEKLHVSRRTLFKWKSEGKMNFSQIGKKLYITEAELKRFLEVNNQNY